MKSWELEKIYREEGRQEGREEGIGALIKTCQEFHISKDETLSKLRQNFPLTQDEAEQYIEKYWE